jgi:peptidoglycan hydrolase CwlO-like protein
MTDEERQRTIDFILEQQAHFTVNLEAFAVNLQAFAVNLEALRESQARTDAAVAQIARQQAHMNEVVAVIADAQQHTDERLSALIDIVREGRNGNA